MSRDPDTRRTIVAAAREVLAGTRTLADFVTLAGAAHDPDVESVIRLLESRSAASDRCGVGGLMHRQYRDQVEYAIQVLERQS